MVKIKYDVSSSDACRYTEDLVSDLRPKVDAEDTAVAVWLPSSGNYPNLMRSLEVDNGFPEMPEVMKGVEEQCRFLAVVDLSPQQARVVHAIRVSSVLENASLESEGPIGVVLLDELVESGQVESEYIRRYYKERGVSLPDSLGVESNFRIDGKGPMYNGVKAADLAYIALFNQLGTPANGTIPAVFAHLNNSAKGSLERNGVKVEPLLGLGGDDALQTPTIHDGVTGFDSRYNPYQILGVPSNMELFKALGAFGVKELTLD